MTNKPRPRTSFHWGVYAEATLAGLSVLIPIPLIDMIFEDFFRRGMPRHIARARGQPVDPEVVSLVNRGDDSCTSGCLLTPLRLTFDLAKRFSKKLLYFLTIHDAVDRVSYYWHRAFLLDYALLLGHLDGLYTANVSRHAMNRVLVYSETNPLAQLARQIVTGTKGIFGHLRRARRGEKDALLEEKRNLLERNWAKVEEYLLALAARYDAAFTQVRLEKEAEAAAETAARAAAERAEADRKAAAAARAEARRAAQEKRAREAEERKREAAREGAEDDELNDLI
jgi:hypothetical protein